MFTPSDWAKEVQENKNDLHHTVWRYYMARMILGEPLPRFLQEGADNEDKRHTDGTTET